MSYIDFCRARGVDPFHPYATWTDEDHAAWYQAKLANFREKWAALKADGTTRLMTREHLRSWVRDSLASLRAPVPTRPWRVCPCHTTPRRVAEDRSEITHGLEWMAATFGARR